MGNNITKEIKDAKNYFFEKTNDGLVKISARNVVIAEAMVKNDSGFYKAYDKNNNKSSAYWFEKLKECEENDVERYKNIIKKVVYAIDGENGTHLNADGCGRDEIAGRLGEYGKEKLFEELRNPDYGDLKLFNKLCEKTNPKDKSKVGRRNKSFASKFCHYACYHLFEGEKEQDNFPIFDSVVKRTIPKYLSDNHYNLDDYSVYISAIDEIIAVSGENISRNGLDHLLWYAFRGKN